MKEFVQWLSENPEAARELIQAAAIVLIVLIAVAAIVRIADRRRMKRGDEQWSEQINHLRRELDNIDGDLTFSNELVAQKNLEIVRKNDMITQKDTLLEQLQNGLERGEQQLEAVRNELNETKDAAASAAQQAQEQLAAKNAQIEELQQKLDRWSSEKDSIIAEANRAASDILNDAHVTAGKIMDEASRRLAESEEEVRRNRLAASNTLIEARRHLSEILIGAAGELCKGLPAAVPVGYAPVYIKDSENSALPESKESRCEE